MLSELGKARKRGAAGHGFSAKLPAQGQLALQQPAAGRSNKRIRRVYQRGRRRNALPLWSAT